MRAKNAGPRGCLPDATPQNIGEHNDTSSRRWGQPARCNLHGVNLWHRLPPRCPLSTPNPLETLARLQDAAWRVLGRGAHDPELSAALALLGQRDTCLECFDRICGHPTVRRLRGRKGVAA